MHSHWIKFGRGVCCCCMITMTLSRVFLFFRTYLKNLNSSLLSAVFSAPLKYTKTTGISKNLEINLILHGNRRWCCPQYDSWTRLHLYSIVFHRLRCYVNGCNTFPLTPSSHSHSKSRLYNSWHFVSKIIFVLFLSWTLLEMYLNRLWHILVLTGYLYRLTYYWLRC